MIKYFWFLVALAGVAGVSFEAGREVGLAVPRQPTFGERAVCNVALKYPKVYCADMKKGK